MLRALKKKMQYQDGIEIEHSITNVRPSGSAITEEEEIRVEPENNGDRSYSVVIGSNNLDEIGHRVKDLQLGDDILVLSDSNVGPLYADRVIESLRSVGFVNIDKMFIAAGEASKTASTAHDILKKVYEIDKNQDKNLTILTLGGGVVGDLGGYVAGIYRRGIHYVQIPTSLLGQVDCGLGGKVGINFEQAKNLIGLFYQPKLVFMDLSVLKTLDSRELKSGYAEVIKYGAINDPDLFKYLEENTSKILNLDFDCLQHVVNTCVQIKSNIFKLFERDEKDIRIMLYFGHTIGHAIEAAAGYGSYTHGEAISIGMLCAGEIACRLDLFSRSNLLKLGALIEKAKLPSKIKGCDIDDIMSSMKHDKKFVGGVNRFVLPVDIGNAEVKSDIDEELIRSVITEKMEV